MVRMSIVTIAWNDLEGVKKTIASVRSQTWGDIEHIVVDGGSTDGTAEYLAGLQEPPLWRSEKDRGRYDAMNKGASLATGDYLWFMNSADEFYDPKSIEFVAESVAAEPIAWGYGLSRIVSGRRVLATAGKIPFERNRYLLGGRPIPHQASVFSTNFFRELGGYDIEFGLTADQLFMMKASMTADPKTWTAFLCNFDASGAGSTRSASAHFKDMARARKRLGIVVTGARAGDAALSYFYSIAVRVERVQRRLLARAKPTMSETL
jgi:glycosyltransferase involved in cell wall biosynthesis